MLQRVVFRQSIMFTETFEKDEGVFLQSCIQQFTCTLIGKP
jgi:hypothetical protein